MSSFGEKIVKHSESIFLILFVGILLWMSIGPIMQYKLVHDMPMGFGASDSYAWYAYAQNIYETGNFKYTAPFMNLGVEGFSSPEPPMFMQFTAFLSYALGIPLYDAQTLLGVLSVIFGALIFFLLIKEYSPFLAYLSLPLCVFAFALPFVNGILVGVLPSIFSFFFLIACIFTLLHMDWKYSSIILGIFISAMIMAHHARVFEFAFFGGAFIILAFLFKTINLNFIKKLLISGLTAFIISLYQLSIFYRRLSESSGNFSFTPSDAAGYIWITINDFGLVKYVILAGLILCVYFLIKERKNPKAIIFIFPIVAFSLLQFLRMNKVYQISFYWPVFLSLPLGIILFFFLQLRLFSKVSNAKLFYLALSLTISLFLVCYSYYSYKGTSVEQMSLIDLNQWNNLVWISKNTEPDSNILFFYFNDFPNDNIYHFFQSKRLSFYVPLSEIDSAIEQNITKKDYEILDNSIAFFYKRDPTSPLKTISLDKNIYLKNMSICDFNYIYGKRTKTPLIQDGKIRVMPMSEERARYTINLINTLLKNNNFEIVRKDNEAYLIKNNNPGGECL